MSKVETELQESIVWESFLKERSTDQRESLIKRYAAFANIIAAKLYANRQINEIEFDEFKQYALVGLIESIDRYDPTRGASFKTYAAHRIKGAILNGIEKHCELQQQISVRARLREERMQELLKETAEKGLDPFARLVDVAIGVAIGYMLEGSGMYQSGEEVQEQSAYHRTELNDLVRVIDSLVATLPDDEEFVIKCHYYQQLRFDHIAEKMQLTKGRVSQIHHRALKRLYEHYDELKLIRTDY